MAFCGLLAGCARNVTVATPPPPPPPPPVAAEVPPPPQPGPRAAPVTPLRINFAADPAEILAGQSVTLRWEVRGADTVRIDQGIGVVAAAGSREVFPAADRTYTLSASGPGGEDTATASVRVLRAESEVREPPPPPPPADEQQIWDSLNKTDAGQLLTFLGQYPGGQYAALARNMLAAHVVIMEPGSAPPAATNASAKDRALAQLGLAG